MLELIIGGSGSGKSEFAEQRCMHLEPGEKIYLATMEAYDEESIKRIQKHRKMRAGKQFQTIECPTHLEEQVIGAHATVLLECMSNLVANELFGKTGRREQAAEVILQGVTHVKQQAEHLIIVTNHVFSDGIAYDPETMHYLRVMAEVNAAIASQADAVYEVVHGIPLKME